MSAPSSAPGSGAGYAATLSGVTHRWPGGFTALTDVGLDVPAGAVIALIGPNGGGKSTLLELLTGRLMPTAGSITVLGLDPNRRADRRELRRRVGYVPQDIALDPEMTGAETLSLFATLYGLPREHSRSRRARLTEEWGLDNHVDRRVGTYSGGLKRRLHLALGEIRPFDLLLLDEPTTALDAGACDLFWHRVDGHRRRGGTTVVATHDLMAAGQHCDLVAVVDGGRVVAFDSPEGLVSAHAAADLAEVYRRVRDGRGRGRA